MSKELASDRSPLWDQITLVWSYIGSTGIVIGVCLLVAGLLLWRTRNWRLAIVPALAILMQAVIFATTSSLVDRGRPDVSKLDESPPTTSYPSGHVGASTGLYLAFAFLALRLHRAWLRWTLFSLCLIPPLLVTFARLYRGMHHVTDVIAGLVNGVVCAVLAAAWYHKRRQPRRELRRTQEQPEAVPGQLSLPD